MPTPTISHAPPALTPNPSPRPKSKNHTPHVKKLMISLVERMHGIMLIGPWWFVWLLVWRCVFFADANL
eukprot:CCRYP_010111-RA/>CCRYP_010111-RA protein AED:0.37 eAED:0.37 QI:0/-1/0/1/-1/0/1/0/68